MKTKKELQTEIKTQELAFTRVRITLEDLRVRHEELLKEHETLKQRFSFVKQTLKTVAEPGLSEAKCYKLIMLLLSTK